MTYNLTMDNLHIEDSYLVDSTDDMYLFLSNCMTEMPESNVWKRSFCSLKNEWVTHNLLYKLHIYRSRTKDVDLNYPQKWYYRLGYSIIGGIASFFYYSRLGRYV